MKLWQCGNCETMNLASEAICGCCTHERPKDAVLRDGDAGLSADEASAKRKRLKSPGKTGKTGRPATAGKSPALPPAGAPDAAGITPIQYRIMGLLTSHYSDKAIGAALSLTESAVRDEVRSLCRIAKVFSRDDLISWSAGGEPGRRAEIRRREPEPRKIEPPPLRDLRPVSPPPPPPHPPPPTPTPTPPPPPPVKPPAEKVENPRAGCGCLQLIGLIFLGAAMLGDAESVELARGKGTIWFFLVVAAVLILIWMGNAPTKPKK